MITTRPAASAAAIAVWALLACGAPRTPEPDRSGQEGASAGEESVLRPSLPPAEAYRAGRADHSRSPLARVIEKRFPSLTSSRCLERAAAAYARLSAGRTDRLPMAAAEFLIHWTGCPDAAAAVATVETTEEGLSPLLEHIARVIVADRYTHVGVGSTVAPDGSTRWVALLTRRRFTLTAVPRRVEPGGSLTLQFTMDPGLTDPRVISTLPGGRIRESGTGSAGRRGVAAVPISGAPGQQWVEVVADGEHGPEVVALFPVAVGQPPQAVLAVQPPAPDPADADAARARLAALVNGERRRHNLHPLDVDPALTTIARAQSEDMAAHGYTGHTSPGHGDIAQRYRAAGYAARAFGENAARGPSIIEVHEGLMRSPGHRANLLSPRFRRMGIGVVRHRTTLGGGEWVVTEEFAAPLDRASLQEIEARLRALVASVPAGGQALHAAGPSRLDGIARELAVAYLHGLTDTTVLTRRAAGRLEAAGVPFQRLALVVGAAFAPADIDSSVAAGLEGAQEVGVGAAAPAKPVRPFAYAVLIVKQTS